MPGIKGQNTRYRPPKACVCGAHAFAPVTRWGVIIVSPEDAHLLVSYCWMLWSPPKAPTIAYAKSSRYGLEHGTGGCLHRAVIPDAQPDHIDGNGLNNQRGNLRPSTVAQNMRNRRANRSNRAGFKGVSLTRNISRPWRARIMQDDVEHRLGNFQTPEEAARAYDAAASKMFGEFARLNFPGGQNADH